MEEAVEVKENDKLSEPQEGGLQDGQPTGKGRVHLGPRHGANEEKESRAPHVVGEGVWAFTSHPTGKVRVTHAGVRGPASRP
eukprot:5690611-Pyramimonas_sp.AAC.1